MTTLGGSSNVAINNHRGNTPRTKENTISATIHTISAAEFKAMGDEPRAEFLALVGSEFLAKTGRGRNIKTVFAMPESYAVLFARRLRQAAKMANTPAEVTEKVILERAKQIAAGEELAPAGAEPTLPTAEEVPSEPTAPASAPEAPTAEVTAS